MPDITKRNTSGHTASSMTYAESALVERRRLGGEKENAFSRFWRTIGKSARSFPLLLEKLAQAESTLFQNFRPSEIALSPKIFR